ncbi:MAG: DUF4350 domain-containing protein [Chromatiales bacterium]|jgi:hypothetical protein
MANRVYLGILLLLLLGLGLLVGAWFVQNFERQSQEIRSGFSQAARRNPWLAAERFLQRLDLQVESLSGRQYLLSPPAEPGVLLVRDLGPALSLQRQQDLLEWVAAGGQLILSLQRVPDADEPNHPLLARFGVSLRTLEASDQAETNAPVAVTLPGTGEKIEVTFDPQRSLYLDEVSPEWQVPGDSGYHLLRFRHGAGAITLLSDNRFLSNAEIDEQDNALLLARLVGDASRGWLLYSSQMPSLLELSWKYASYLVVSVCLTLAVLLWWLSNRSGPLLVQTGSQRRDLLEHLQAAAEFLWQQERAAGLQTQTRSQIEKRWLRSHPRLTRLDRQGRCEWLAQRTGLNPEAIDGALYGQQTDERGLIRASAVLQRLNLALHPEITMEYRDGRYNIT